MLTHIICITCGCPLGHISILFEEMRREYLAKVLEEKGYAPEMLSTDLAKDINYGEICDSLCITNICCRMHLITSVNFTTATQMIL